MKKVLGLLLVLVLGFVSGTEYYVDKDSIGGTCSNSYSLVMNDLNHPWCTIQKATSTMIEGDTIIVRRGIYNERIYFQKSNIVLKGYDGELPVIDGNFNLPSGIYGNVSQLVQVNTDKATGYKNFTFENFEVRESYGNGIGAFGTDGVIFRNLVIHDIMAGGISTKGSSNMLIENVTLYNIAERHIRGVVRPWPVCLSLANVVNATIRKSKVFNCSGEGIGTMGSSNVIIENNTVYDARAIGIYFNWGDNISINNNLVYSTRTPKFYRNDYGTTGASISMANEAPEHSPSAEKYLAMGLGNNLKIYNNLIVGGVNGISVGGGYIDAENVSIFNNIVIESIYSDNTPVNLKIGKRLRNVYVRNNIFIQKDGRLSAIDSPTTFSNNYWSKDPIEADVDSTSIVGGNLTFLNDVDWKNIMQGELTPEDFVLKETPLIVDNGVDVGINKDFFGNTRDNRPDIGAVEYGGSFSPPIILENCTNSVDDDLDGLIDCLDSNCSACVPPTDVVDVSDIFAKIAEWKTGRISLDDVFVVIRAWGDGGWL